MSIRRCQQSPSWNGDETEKPPHKRLLPEVTGTFMPPDLVAIFKHVRNHVQYCQQPQSWNEEANKILTQTLDVWSRSLNFIKLCYCSTNRQIDKRLTFNFSSPRSVNYLLERHDFWVSSEHKVQFPSLLTCNAYAQFVSVRAKIRKLTVL